MNFNAAQWLSDNGVDARTKTTIAGIKMTLKGIPSESTDEELAALAFRQPDDVRCSLEKTETAAGHQLSRSAKVKGETVAQLVIAASGIGRENPETAKRNNGRAKASAK